MLHGFAETSRALEAARGAALNRYGWNVAALDSRGHGESEGHFSTFGGLEARDIQRWLDELPARVARTDPALSFRPVLWGRSMGAAIALRAASVDSRAVALVLEAPMVDIVRSTATVLRRRRLAVPEVPGRLVVRRAGKLAGMRIDRPGPLETAPRVRCPTVIIHGTDDSIVPCEEARRLADAFPLPPHWFDVAGAKHIDVIDKGGEPLLEQIAAVLDKAAGRQGALREADDERFSGRSIFAVFDRANDRSRRDRRPRLRQDPPIARRSRIVRLSVRKQRMRAVFERSSAKNWTS